MEVSGSNGWLGVLSRVDRCCIFWCLSLEAGATDLPRTSPICSEPGGSPTDIARLLGEAGKAGKAEEDATYLLLFHTQRQPHRINVRGQTTLPSRKANGEGSRSRYFGESSESRSKPKVAVVRVGLGDSKRASPWNRHPTLLRPPPHSSASSAGDRNQPCFLCFQPTSPSSPSIVAN